MNRAMLRFAGIVALSASPLRAQTQEDNQQPATTQLPPSEAPATAAALPAAAQTLTPDPMARFDGLNLKGWDIPFPKTDDTLLRDVGGFRSALADLGIGVFGISGNHFAYNLRDDTTPGATYNGKHPTYFVGVQTLFVTFDTGKIGIPNGQLIWNGVKTTNGLTGINGVRYARITDLDYYQQLFEDRVEIKVGYHENLDEFVGSAVAGSLANGNLGPQSQIPVELGLSYNGIGAPGLNIKIRGSDGLYTKLGVQRSVPPGGANVDVPLNDSVGLRFSLPDARALGIGEIGIKRPSAPGEKSIWIRGGGIYNSTPYRDFATGLMRSNWAVYAAADRQLTQPDQQRPYRGLYIGASMNYAPPTVNLFSQYYEGRIYDIGLINSRPSDLATLVISANKLSATGLAAAVPVGPTQNYVISAIGSYAYRLVSGLYLQPGLGIVKNSTFAPKVPLAVNGYLTVSFLL